MPVTPEQAIAAAADQSVHGPAFGTGLCLQRVRMCYGVEAREPDAAAAWHNAQVQHPTTDPVSIPRGVPVFWVGGSAGHGHIAISTGDGYCWSTDILRPGYFDKVAISEIQRRWGMKLVGWTEDINGVTVYTPPVPSRGVRVDAAVKALRGARRKATGRRLTKISRALEILRSIPRR